MFTHNVPRYKFEEDGYSTMQKKSRNPMVNWSIAVVTGAVLIGSGVYIGLETATQRNSLAKLTDPEFSAPGLAGSVDESDLQPQQGSVSQTPPINSENEDPAFIEAQQVGEQTEFSSDSVETDLADTELDEPPFGEESMNNSSDSLDVENDGDLDPLPDTNGRKQRAPAVAPAAAVRLANGEEVLVPGDRRVDQYLASRYRDNIEGYVGDSYDQVAPSDAEFFPPRPTN